VRLRPAAMLLSALALVACGGSRLDATVLDVQADGDAWTYTFEPETAWTMTYGWDCTTQREQNVHLQAQFSLVLYNADDASLAAEHPTLQKSAVKGGGTLKFVHPGAYTARVTTPCSWRLKAVKGAGA
jgi:hypothetical protein